MANLITAYYTNKKIPKNIEFVPGDIIVLSRIINELFIGNDIILELYIVDLNRDPMFISKRCTICERFHINKTQYKNYLGNHWKKYKYRYFYNLGLPITNKECYVS